MWLILLSCLIWWPALIGWGEILLRGIGSPKFDREEGDGLRGVVGLWWLGMVGMAISFFTAVGGAWPIGMWVAGILLFIVQRASLIIGWTRAKLGGAILLLAVLSAVSAKGVAVYDSGLYHLKAIEWLATGPTPLGLANLHRPLSINSSLFTASAMLELPMLRQHGFQLVNVLATQGFGLILWGNIARLLAGESTCSRWLMVLAGLPLAIIGFSLRFIGSPSPDLPLMMVLIYAASLYLRSRETGEQRGECSRVILLLIAIAVSLKVTAGVVALGLGLAASVEWTRAHRTARVRRYSREVVLSLLILLSLGLTFARGIWMCGYPMYPATILRWPGSWWAVPEAEITFEREVIKYWSRTKQFPWDSPREGWVKLWFERNIKGRILGPLMGMTVIAIGLRVYVGRRKGDGLAEWVILGISIGGIVFWWISAPDLRYALAALFLLPLILLAGAMSRIELSRRRLIQTLGVLGLIGLALSRLSMSFRLDWPVVPTTAHERGTTLAGVEIWRPIGTDQSWLAPLMSTPVYHAGMNARFDANGRPTALWIESK